MDPMDVKSEVQRLFEAKQSRRTELARLSFPEKVQIVIQLQKWAAPLLRARGKNVRVWNLGEDLATPSSGKERE
jgi:hypothetical protein